MNLEYNPQLFDGKRMISETEHKRLMLYILNELDTFCQDKNIKYFAYYGTLIGAIRHNGYIPWDDDIDLAMDRENYNRFINEFSSKSNKITLINNQNEEEYPFNFSKLYLNDTILHEPNMISIYYGIYIDIFPIDSIPCEELKRNLYHHIIHRIYDAINLKIRFNKKRSTVLKSILSSISYYVLRLVRTTFLTNRIESIIKRASHKKSRIVGNLTLPTYFKRDFFPSEWLDDTMDCKFEDTTVKVPKHYNEILKQLYGDYMKLPPQDKRVSHHNPEIAFLNHM